MGIIECTSEIVFANNDIVLSEIVVKTGNCSSRVLPFMYSMINNLYSSPDSMSLGQNILGHGIDVKLLINLNKSISLNCSIFTELFLMALFLKIAFSPLYVIL
jgi:hypothetical protein